MVKAIIAQEGYVDKFIGDAIMAVFRGDYHLDRAIDAALAIREEIQEIPEVEGTGHYRPKVSIGIKSGEMVSGNIGSASLKRLDYTVIGDTVNIAARLQDAAAENQILISEDCHERIKESFKCRKVGDLNLKNKSGTLTVYEVLE
jgi:adenylate cyclase